MPDDSIQNDIIDEIVSIIEAQNFAIGTTTIPVQKRKLPKKGEAIDPPVQIAVTPSHADPEEMEFASFEAGIWKTYHTMVTIISPNSGDNLTHLDTYLHIRDRICHLFKTPLPVTGVLLTWTTYEVPIDPDAVSDLYDYSALCVVNQTYEDG